MKKSSKILVLPFFAILLCLSCKKKPEATPENLQTSSRSIDEALLSYYGFFEQKSASDGEIGIFLYNTHATQNSNKQAAQLISMFFDKQTRKEIKFAQEIFINNEKFLPSPGTYSFESISEALASSFGANNMLKIKTDNQIAEQSIYFPEKITANLEEVSDDPYVFIIRNDATISWNKDENNTKGIVIWLRYDPSLQNSSGETIDKFIGIPEGNGTYRFTSNDLKDFPKNKPLDIQIGRANYQFVPLDGKVIAVYGLTYVSLTAILK